MALSNNASIKEVIDTFEQINGKIIDRGGARTITPSASNQVLSKGNYKGDITILGDSNLKEENIKQGVKIFGKTGTLVSAQKIFRPRIMAVGESFEYIDGDNYTTLYRSESSYGSRSIGGGSVNSEQAAMFCMYSGSVSNIDIYSSTYSTTKFIRPTVSDLYNLVCVYVKSTNQTKYFARYNGSSNREIREINIANMSTIRTVYTTTSYEALTVVFDESTNKLRMFTSESPNIIRERNPDNGAIIRTINTPDPYNSISGIAAHYQNGKVRLFISSKLKYNNGIWEIDPDNFKTLGKRVSGSTTNYYQYGVSSVNVPYIRYNGFDFFTPFHN